MAGDLCRCFRALDRRPLSIMPSPGSHAPGGIRLSIAKSPDSRARSVIILLSRRKEKSAALAQQRQHGTPHRPGVDEGDGVEIDMPELVDQEQRHPRL